MDAEWASSHTGGAFVSSFVADVISTVRVSVEPDGTVSTLAGHEPAFRVTRVAKVLFCLPVSTTVRPQLCSPSTNEPAFRVHPARKRWHATTAVACTTRWHRTA